MPDETNSQNKKVDPTGPWTEVRDIYLDAWSKAMIDTVNSEAYAQANGALLETCLTASSPFRIALEKGMAQAFQQLNMPSREDFAALSERLTHIEMRLDDMDAKLDGIGQFFSRPVPAKSAPASSPARPRNQKKGAKS